MSVQGNTVGEIKRLNKEANILWKVPYFNLPHEANSSYRSPYFHFLGSTWYLEIFPNGHKLYHSVGFIGLYIRRLKSDENVLVDFDISIVRGKGYVCKNNARHCFSKEIDSVGWPKCIERQFLIQNMSEAAPQGILTIKFVGKSSLHSTNAASRSGILDGVNGLMRDIQKLFSSEQKSDAEIKVQNRTFHVHTLILAARSPVFAAMFEHDMKEKNTGLVNIVDCDPDTFQDFLQFLYTGKIENLTSDNSIDLYSLANKYDLSDLKQICIVFMKENMCLGTVCDVLVTADKFGDTELKIAARQFLIENTKTVTTSENWIHFVTENPVLATEILLSLR